MVTKECVREIIYKDKERIIDRIVSQASSHTRTLAVKKMVEQIEKGHEHGQEETDPR